MLVSIDLHAFTFLYRYYKHSYFITPYIYIYIPYILFFFMYAGCWLYKSQHPEAKWLEGRRYAEDAALGGVERLFEIHPPMG